MASAPFDSHATVKELRAAGFSEEQAEAVARIMAVRLETDLAQLATKADMARLEGDLRLLRWMVGLSLFLSSAILLRLVLPGLAG